MEPQDGAGNALVVACVVAQVTDGASLQAVAASTLCLRGGRTRGHAATRSSPVGECVHDLSRPAYGQVMNGDSATQGTGRVAFGRIVRDANELPTDSLDELRLALAPGTMTERHRRVWRMGQTREDDGVIFGRIGFQSRGSVTEVWNAEKNDFEEQVFPSGVTSPFAIRTADFRIAFQLRGGTIRRQSFVGAFQALLREASRSRWIVESLRREVAFSEWRHEVDRIVSMRFRLERPNPHYGDRDFVRELVYGTGSAMASILLRTHDDDLSGLDVDSDFVSQAVEHASTYGTFRAVGERQVDGETERVDWDLASGGEVQSRTVGADPQTGEVPQAELGQELTAAASEAEAYEQNGDDPAAG